MISSQTQSHYHPIDCSLHDELELLCLRREAIMVYLSDGAPVTGIAANWISASDKAEYLIMESHCGKKRIRLDRICKIAIITRRAVARTIDFRRVAATTF